MHHLMARSVAEEVIFRDGGDYATGVGILAGVIRDGLASCHAFCFMPTHYHLLGELADVSAVAHKLNRRYAVAFNRRYRRHGPVFDGHTAVAVRSERHFLNLARHLALNPDRYDTWPYSSYPGLIGIRTPFSFVDPAPLVGAFGSIDELRRFVDEGAAQRRESGSGFAGNRVPSYSAARGFGSGVSVCSTWSR